MTVLVAAASKYGATWEIAQAIGRGLSERGFEVEVRRVEEVDDVVAFEAVVVGSAVYAGHWLEQARRFVEANAGALRTRPTWLFSSGPIGDPQRPAGKDAVQLDAILTAAKPTAHRVFAGRLDKGKLNFAERAIAFAFRAAEGDFRDWYAIAAWADGIADVLEATSSSAQLSSMPSASA